MQDRQPGAPGQYKATLTAAEFQKMQAGEQFTITMTRDDQPIVEGTPYSKAAVLPDDLAAKICPDVLNPTPADALAALLPRNGTTHMTGDLQMGNHRVKDVAAPEEDGDVVNLGYMNEHTAPAGYAENGHDTIIAQGISGIWKYRKWASGIAEVFCFASITPTVSNAWAGGGHYSETLRFHLPFPSVGRITTVGTCSANIAYLANISCNENDISFLICAPHEINKEAHYCSLYAAYRWK